MFENLAKLEKGNVLYISLNDIEDYILMNNNMIKLSESWMTPFYIASQKTYEIYSFKLVMNRNMSFDEYICLEFINNMNISNEILNRRRACYINIDDSVSDRVLTERFSEYLNFIKCNKEIADEISGLFGGFDSKNLYFEYIE